VDAPDKKTSLAARIADGSDIDWAAAQSATGSPDDRALMDELRAIAGIATAHRAPSTWPAQGQPPTGTWGPLTILEPLGTGRFGDVYLAWDARLQRRVALKLLRVASSSRGSPTRAIDEARLLARVRHPNVLTVYGAEYLKDQVGIWTEFIEGRTLAAQLAENGPLDVDEVVDIGVDLCRALSAVHDAGLLHRDIKAQNVMRETGGRIVLMDFGAGYDLALAPARDGDLTGTPLYLAPEVLAGGAASPATDVYALGVLLFHLLTGTHPVAGRTLEDVRAGHECGERRHLRDVRADLPARLTEVIERALETDPGRRYASAGAMGAGLAGTRTPAWLKRNRWAAAGLFILLAAAGVAMWRGGVWPGAGIPFEQRDSILIAAFENATGEPQLDRVVEAALHHELVNSRFVTVVGQNRIDETLRLMQRPLDTVLSLPVAHEVAERDGAVRMIVSGQINKIGASYVVTAGLIAPADGRPAASVQEDAIEIGELPAALRRLSNRLRAALGEARGEIRASDVRLERVTTPSPLALTFYTDSYARGLRGQWSEALERVQLALDADSEFASAHIWLAWCLLNTRQQGFTPEVAAAAERAVALAAHATDWERYWIEGSALVMADDPTRRPETVTKYKALLDLQPTHYWGLGNLMTALRWQKRASEAVPYALAAVKLEPNSQRLNMRTFGLLQEVCDVERAQFFFDRVRELERVNNATISMGVIQFPAVAAYCRGDIASTVAELDALAASLPGLTGTRMLHRNTSTMLKEWYLGLGRPRTAVRVAEEVDVADARELWLASIAFFGDDLGGLQQHMARVRLDDATQKAAFDRGWMTFSKLEGLIYLLKLGDVRVVETQRAKFNAPPQTQTYSAVNDAFQGCISLEHGDIDRAIALLTSARTQAVVRPGWDDDCLAEAWVRHGNIAKAVETLQFWESGQSPMPPPSAYRTRHQMRLAELYFADGRDEAARELVDRVALTLSQAEPGFPLVERVRRLQEALRPGQAAATSR